MEPEVHIIEKYFQEVLECFTMTNIRCKGGKEIDLLAMNPATLEKYHVEARISTSRGFAIREKDTHTSKGRAHKIGLDYFQKQKFEHPVMKDRIHGLFGESDYRKILVVWNTEDDFLVLPRIAKEKYGFEVLGLRNIIHELMQKKGSTGSRDDIMRLMELIALEEKEAQRESFRLIEKAIKEKVIRNRKDKEHARELLNAVRLAIRETKT
jgi:hypothetical protein